MKNKAETNWNDQVLIKMALSAWDTYNTNLVTLIDSLTDEQLSREVAPGKNTGVYLLGHLMAISDGMLPILGFGEKLFPHLEDVFVNNPDRSGLEKPGAGDLKKYLKAVNEKLSEKIKAAAPHEWFSRHMLISPEDFAKEPHRNKLNVIINRTNHMAYHFGQLLLLK